MSCAKLKQLAQSMAGCSHCEGFQQIKIPFTLQLSLKRKVILYEFSRLFIILFAIDTVHTARFSLWAVK
jgi:hypothetical protein